jgi:endo-1,4-beta-xylanase
MKKLLLKLLRLLGIIKAEQAAPVQVPITVDPVKDPVKEPIPDVPPAIEPEKPEEDPVIIPTDPPIVVAPIPPAPAHFPEQQPDKPVEVIPEPAKEESVKPDPVIEVPPVPVPVETKPEPVIVPFPKPSPAPDPMPPAASLKQSPVKWGVAFKEGDLKNAKVIEKTYEQFESLTPENGIKTGHVQPKEGQFDFSDAKALVKLAKAKSMRVHGHACFVWPGQEKNLPAFWHEAAKVKDKYIALLKKHVQTTVKEFKNDIFSWDITNEAHQDNGKPRPCYALTHMGESYPEQIAKWVLEVQPTANNFISDYDFETASKKATVVIAYAGELKRKGLVHGISSQMHTNLKMDYKQFKKRLDEMAKNNLLVHLSELDIACKPTEEVQRSAKYKEITTGFRTLPATLQYGITTWSYTHGKNFMNYKKVPMPYAPAIFDDEFKGGLSLASILQVK